MSKYRVLADALVVSPPLPPPDVVTLTRASAALRELEAERDRLREAMQEAVRDFHGKAVLWKAGFPHLRFSSRFLELAKEGE